jgi:chromosome segregation ATPase
MYALSTSQTHEWHHDSDEDEIGLLQVQLEESRLELKTKTEKVDELTFELEELSNVCTDQDEMIHTLKLEINKLISTLETVKKILQNPEKYTVTDSLSTHQRLHHFPDLLESSTTA